MTAPKPQSEETFDKYRTEQEFLEDLHKCGEEGFGCEYEDYFVNGQRYARCKLLRENWDKLKALSQPKNTPKGVSRSGMRSTEVYKPIVAQIDEIILDLVWQDSLLPRGKTVTAEMFSNSREAILALLTASNREARIEAAEYIEHQMEEEPEAPEVLLIQDYIATLKAENPELLK